jgi:hypothetical protein
LVETGPDGGQAVGSQWAPGHVENGSTSNQEVVLAAHDGKASFLVIDPPNRDASCWTKNGLRKNYLKFGFGGRVGPFVYGPVMYCHDQLPSVTPFSAGVEPANLLP